MKATPTITTSQAEYLVGRYLRNCVVKKLSTAPGRHDITRIHLTLTGDYQKGPKTAYVTFVEPGVIMFQYASMSLHENITHIA